METFDIEITQTLKITRKISAHNEAEALRKANEIIAEDKIPIEQYQFVKANVKIYKADNVIPIANYR